MTDAQFVIWLQSSSRDPVALVEIDHVVELIGSPSGPQTQTLCFATKVFESRATDTPASKVYADDLTGVPAFTRALDEQTLGGRASVSFGQIEIANADGSWDAILNYAYDGSEVRVYYGDVSWPKADFRLVFTAFGSSVSAPTTKKLQFVIRDTNSLLNSNMSAYAVIGGTGPNAGAFQPINLGFVHNVELFVENSAFNVYRYGNSGIEAVIVAVRDRGVDLTPAGWTDNADGTVTLAATPAGQITADIQQLSVFGDPTSWRLSNLLEAVAGQYGGLYAAGRFTGASTHSSFVIGDDQDYYLGISIRDGSRNLLDLLDEMAVSGNIFYSSLSSGIFSYGRIFPFNPPGPSLLELGEDDIVPFDSIQVRVIAPLYDQIQCLGNRNWTVQSDFGSVLTQDEQAIYTRAGFKFSEANPSGDSYVDNPRLYNKTLSLSPLFDTLISSTTDVSVAFQLAKFSEIARKRLLPWLRIFEINVGLRALRLEIGDVVTLTLPRFGLDLGAAMQVISTAIDVDSEQVRLKLAHRIGVGSVEDRFLLQLNGGYILQQNGGRIRIT